LTARPDIRDFAGEPWMDRLVTALDPLARVTQPAVDGIEHVPDAGALLVGNHTIYGVLDVPFLLAELWRRRRIAVRSLGDHAHFGVPLWRDLLEAGGTVRGTRENTRELMRRGENILVFPGGSREVNKRRGERYRLIWKERIGFAKLAIEHGYHPIVPFAAVGGDDMLDVVVDEDNPVFAQFTKVVRRVTGWPLQPIVRGVGPTPIPRPQRLYFWFGEPIETDHLGGRDDDVAARALRDEVRRAVEGGIEHLLAVRDADPHRGLAARVLGRAPD
jgi:1-acyl-sn-glycerol-3-phosphate acyltransferase